MTHPTVAHIVKLLHQADGVLAKGQSVEDFCRRKHISTGTYYRWKRKYGGLNSLMKSLCCLRRTSR